MSKSFINPAYLSTAFNIEKSAPIDSRLVLDSEDDLYNGTIEYPYEGLVVNIKGTDKLWVLIENNAGTGKPHVWKRIQTDLSGIQSQIDELNKKHDDDKSELETMVVGLNKKHNHDIENIIQKVDHHVTFLEGEDSISEVYIEDVEGDGVSIYTKEQIDEKLKNLGGGNTTELETRISSLEGSVENLITNLNVYISKVNSLESNNSSLQSQINELKSIIDELTKPKSYWRIIMRDSNNLLGSTPCFYMFIKDNKAGSYGLNSNDLTTVWPGEYMSLIPGSTNTYEYTFNISDVIKDKLPDLTNDIGYIFNNGGNGKQTININWSDCPLDMGYTYEITNNIMQMSLPTMVVDIDEDKIYKVNLVEIESYPEWLQKLIKGEE